MSSEMTWQGDFIGGEFVKASDPNGEILSKNPGDLDQDPIRFPFGYEHVGRAIEAALEGFNKWKRFSPSDRYEAVGRYCESLKKNKEKLAFALSLEGGKPLWESQQEIEETIALIDYFLKAPSITSQPTQVSMDLQAPLSGQFRYFPRGVMAVIAPSTLPLYYSHSHFIPALLAGNSIVMKSSKFNPLTGQLVADVSKEAALPTGTINVLHGDAELARRLIRHKEIQNVFFTGSHEKGVRIRKEIVSDYWKVTVLLAGGNNSALIWEDCQYEKALYDTLFAAFVTTGQRYTSTRRVILHEKLFDRFREDFHMLSKKIEIGYGARQSDSPPFMGPLVSEAKMENYLRYQGIAVREGCEEIMRGKTLEKENRGYYVSPSIHHVKEHNPNSSYEKEEFFGPNVALYKVSSLEESISILNSRCRGLVHTIYSEQAKHFEKLVDEVGVGLLHWNCPTTTSAFRLPICGTGKSGSSRPMGSLAQHQCTYPKSSITEPEAQVGAYLGPLPKL